MRFALLAIVVIGCASKQAVHKENIVGLPVVLPLAMCAESGKVAVSLGKEGERMICERTAPLGTHLPNCICRDEGMIAQQRDETQELIHRWETHIQLAASGAASPPGK